MASSPRVPIIDDDPDWITAATMVLESEGYTVDSALDGDEGLAQMERQEPDLLLLDVVMNRPLEGVEVSQEIAKRQDLRGVPVIMVTSVVDTEHRDDFLQNE